MLSFSSVFYIKTLQSFVHLLIIIEAALKIKWYHPSTTSKETKWRRENSDENKG